MNSPRDETELAGALRSLRPTPRPEFAAELDARVAAGFPRRRGHPAGEASRLLARLRSVPPRRLLAPAGAFAVAALLVATAVIAISGDDATNGGTTALGPAGKSGSGETLGRIRRFDETAQAESTAPSKASAGAGSAVAPASSESSSGVQFSAAPPRANGPYASHARGRDVERAAQIVLGAEPADVRDDAARVFEAVHAADGIVLNSSIRDGGAGEAGARFELLIPAAKLSDAMASFSSIADVVSRHESTADITAPTVGVTERLADSNARAHSLLGQLAAAESDAEREAVEAELHAERRHQAALRSRLSDLHRRANLSHVSLRIETGEQSADEGSSGGWGVGDGLDAAGRVLAIAAGVLVIGLAILAPLALIALLGWLAHRAWLRRARMQALSQ